MQKIQQLHLIVVPAGAAGHVAGEPGYPASSRVEVDDLSEFEDDDQQHHPGQWPGHEEVGQAALPVHSPEEPSRPDDAAEGEEGQANHTYPAV